MKELSRAWGPNAISRWSIITGAFAMIAVALPGGIGGTDELGVRVGTAIGALMAGGLVLGAARISWLSPAGAGARGAYALVTFAAAGAVAGGTRFWLTEATDATDPLGATWRIVSGAVVAVIWLSVTAIVVDHVREHRENMATLRQRQQELEDIDRREREELESLAARLRDELLVPARDAIHRIEAALMQLGAGGSATDEAQRIEQAVAMSIRPLSHEILSAEPTVDTEVPAAPRGDRWARLTGRAARRVTHSPWIVTAIPVVLSPLQLGPSWGPTFLVVNALVSWPAYALMLVGLRRVLEPRLQDRRTPTAAMLLALGYATVSGAAIAITWALGFLSPREVPYFWIGIITFTAILLAASVLEAAADLADDDERALRDVLARIAVSVTRIQQQLRHEYQTVGALLHGPVQGALLGVAAMLEQAPAELPEPDRRALVAGALDRLADVESRLEAPASDAEGIDELLDGVMVLWTRALDVRLNLHGDARSALDASPAARVAVADVVAEALTNALRHGRARSAEVVISMDQDSACVRVVDDGEMEGAAAPGMGSRLYDESSHRWSLRPVPGGGTELLLLVPAGASGGSNRRTP